MQGPTALLCVSGNPSLSRPLRQWGSPRVTFGVPAWGERQGSEHVPQLSDVCHLHYMGQVNEAEEERLRGEREHQRVTRLCQQAEARVQALQKTLRRAIGKSRPYFELKAQFSQILEVAAGRGEVGEGGHGK